MKTKESKGGQTSTKKGDKKHLYTKIQEQLYEILTGKLKYSSATYADDLLKPDLILKLDLPTSQTIPLSQFLKIEDLLAVPSQLMERTYQKIKKDILKDMMERKELNDATNLRIRYQHSIQAYVEANHQQLNQEQMQNIDNDLKYKRLRYLSPFQEEELVGLPCVNEINGVLDGFTLIFNSIVSVLQKECGFRVKSFLLGDQNKLKIYLFLYNNVDNLLKIANKYKIKKEVQYEYYDFSLNEPYTKDFRPIRLNSAFSDWKQIKKRETAIMRHFEVNSIPKEQIIQEQQISDNEIYNYSSYLNIMHEIMMRLKQNNRKLSQAEKSYIFDYNRGKLNLGCENIMKKYLNLLEFLAIEDQILRLHGYQVLQRPKVFSQFYLLMNKKLSSFFQKLQTILMYKPLLVGKEGQLSLFSTMERSKLSYLILKEKFHLHKIQSSFGAKVFIPHNSFQKFGAVVDDVKTGGLDGKNLADAWLPFSLYLDIDTIRSYAGQQLAYIVMYQQYLIIFLLLVVIPFLTIFAIETVYGAPIFPITTQFQIIFMGITYQIYLQSWIRAQEKYINDYTEGVKSKAFLNHFSGPFVRNPVSDQANQFVEDAGLLIWIRRLISLIIIFAILVAFGGIFHGCKMVLLEIHEDLKGYFISDLPYISLPYLLAYFIFFLVETLSKYLLTARFIFKWLTLLNNPCSDEEQQRLMDKFKFMYSIGIELIGPVLLIIIYPSQRTSCYSSSCIDEIIYYCYSRFIFLICVLLIQLLYMVGYFLKGKVTKAKQQMKVNKLRFEQRLKKMLKIALQQQQLPEYKEDTIDALVPLFLIIMFVNTLSQSSLIVLTSILIMFIRLRLKIFYKVKRTLNKSNTIINISSKLRIIYYIGLSVNCWTNVQTFQNLRQYLQPFILLLQSRATLSEQVLQLIELFAILINFFAIILLAALCQITFQAFDNNFLQTRKNNKVKNYRFKIQKTKLMPLVTNETPLKTVFRTFPPDLQLQRKFNQRLQTLNLTQQKLQSYKLASAQVINVPANSGL